MSKHLQLTLTALCLLPFMLGCSDRDGDSDGDGRLFAEVPPVDFSAADARMQQFIDESEVFDGISYTVVRRQQGMVHEAAFGDHSLDTIVMLASTSKMPAALLLAALDEDAALDFDISAPIGNYLPWNGVYGDATTEQLLSNTSGIPGLSGLANYGAHLCQYGTAGQLQTCAEALYTTELPGSTDPGTAFSYGGSQWQLAGAVAEQVGGASWRQLLQQYLGEPCNLEVFQFGNQWSNIDTWTGQVDSLTGLDNPNIEGGAITNLQDYAKILQLVLDGGVCNGNRVLSAAGVASLQIDRGGPLGVPYGMGWWLQAVDGDGPVTIFYDPGAFGAISWIDTERGYGGYVAIDDYSRSDAGAPTGMVLADLIPLIAQAMDAADSGNNN